MIIDTHVHIWNLERSAYDWLKAAPDLLNKNYNLEDLEEPRLAASVAGGIVVQADNTLDDTALMIEAAVKYDWIKGIVGWLPLLNPAKTDQMLQSVLSGEKYFKGVRHLIHDEPDDQWLLQDAVIESLQLLSARQLPYDVVGVKTTHIQTALEVAGKVPGLRMVFDHLNQPPIQAGERFGEWGRLMKAAALHPQFYCKISGLGTTAGKENFTAEHIKPYVDFVLTEFGPERCFLGGDWPVSLLGGSYVHTWAVYKQVVEELVSDEHTQNRIFSENAIAFYNLNL
ncbi:amidohydrolase family protein [Niabella sp. 22666]|uniref:amidohydrolase family protein n=1 Tax=Niabella sp. 22666 TaxID=3453954 RepID=UPI003F8747E5